MNVKIFNKLQEIIQHSPQVMIDKQSLKVAVSGVFGVDIDAKSYNSIVELSYEISQAVLKKYYTETWKPQTQTYIHSGFGIADEINALEPTSVVDIGCGYNEFKDKINNLIGVDAFNEHADIISSTVDYNPENKHDIAICFDSVNFGSADNVFFELAHIVSKIVNPGGFIFFRANTKDTQHCKAEQWIDFFEWSPEFVVNSARVLGCIPVICKQDNDSLFFVWKTHSGS